MMQSKKKGIIRADLYLFFMSNSKIFRFSFYI